MDEEEELTACECGEMLLGSVYMLGCSGGLEEGAKHFRARAGEEYARGGRDDIARIYREVAVVLEGLAEKRRAEYDNRYEPHRKAAFARLEAIDLALKGESEDEMA